MVHLQRLPPTTTTNTCRTRKMGANSEGKSPIRRTSAVTMHVSDMYGHQNTRSMGATRRQQSKSKFFPRRRVKPTQPSLGIHLFREHYNSRQFATRKLRLHLVQQQHSACPEQAWALARSRWDRIHRSGGIAAAPHINPEQRMLLSLAGLAAFPTATSSAVHVTPSRRWPTCLPATPTPTRTCTTIHPRTNRQSCTSALSPTTSGGPCKTKVLWLPRTSVNMMALPLLQPKRYKSRNSNALPALSNRSC